MVNIELKTLMLQIIAVVIVLMAWRCDVVKTVWQENRTFIAEQKMLAQTTLTATEVDDFIRLWPQYRELKLQASPSSSLSIYNKQFMDLKTKIWFRYHKLDGERFFYVRQRLIDILQQLTLKRTSESVIKQMQNRDDDLALDVMEQHQNKLKSLQFDVEETAIIEQREEQLRQLFRLYP